MKGFTRSATILFGEARAAMRVTSMVAGLAVVLAACGGEKKAENQTTAAPEQSRAPRLRHRRPRRPLAAATHDVNMMLEGSTYKFDPSDLTIKVGRRGQLPQQDRRAAQRLVLGRQHSGRRGGRAQEGDARPDGAARGSAPHRARGRLQGQLRGRARRGTTSSTACRTSRWACTARSRSSRRRTAFRTRRGDFSESPFVVRCILAVVTGLTAVRTAPSPAPPRRPRQPRQRVHGVVHLTVHHAHGQEHGWHEQHEAEPPGAQCRGNGRGDGRGHVRAREGGAVRAPAREGVVDQPGGGIVDEPCGRARKLVVGPRDREEEEHQVAERRRWS